MTSVQLLVPQELRGMGVQNYSPAVYYLPVFELLENSVTQKQLDKLIAENSTDCYPIGKRWDFREVSCFPMTTLQRQRLTALDDSDGLFQMGGMYGFTGILILLRRAELEKDGLRHSLLLQDAYRSFPDFCRNPRFKRHWKEFYEALFHIHGMLHTSYLLVKHRPTILKKQIEAKEHITERICRPRSPVDGRFSELEEPFVLARFP